MEVRGTKGLGPFPKSCQTGRGCCSLAKQLPREGTPPALPRLFPADGWQKPAPKLLHSPKEALHIFHSSLAETEMNLILILTFLKANQSPVQYTLFTIPKGIKLICMFGTNYLQCTLQSFLYITIELTRVIFFKCRMLNDSIARQALR